MTELLAQLPLLQSLPTQTLEHILRHPNSRLRHYREAETICRQGAALDSLMVLLRGRVRTQMIGADGKALTIETLQAPNLLAPAFLFCTDAKIPVMVEALTEVSVLYISRPLLLETMQQHQEVMLRYLTDVADRGAFLAQRVNALSLQSLRERLISYLRAEHTQTTQEELAQRLGVARPSLGRVIAALEEEGILRREGGKLRLLR